MFPFTSAAAASMYDARDVLSGVAAFRPILNAPIAVNGDAQLALMQSVSGNYHAVLGVNALIGRTLTERDRDPVAVISHRYWRSRFAADPNVVGRTVDIQGRSFTIVGVTAAGFFGTQPGRYIDVTVPIGTQTQQMPPNARWLYLVGRLAPGVSRDQARAALRVRWAQLVKATPTRVPTTLEVDAGAQGLNELRREFSLPLRILMAVMGVVLLVACANLAGLLIARSRARQHEIAVRRSLGASRGRIIRQLLCESAVLAAAGGTTGVWLAYRMTSLLLAMMSRGRTPLILDVALNGRTLLFAALVTITATLMFGLLPAMSASRSDVQPSLKQGAFGGERTRGVWGRAMVATQVALLVLLLTTAGLFVRTLQNLRAVDTGFRPDQVLVMNVATGAAYRGARARALYDDLSARIIGLPGVRSISMSMDTPLGGEPSMSSTGIPIIGRPQPSADDPRVYHNLVGPHFFETMEMPILSGRDFTDADDEQSLPCVIVSDSLARRYFPGEDPLGRQILFQATPATIVGVVKDTRYDSLRGAAPLMTYRPYRQVPMAPANTFVIRTSSDRVDAVITLLHGETRRAAPGLPPPQIVRLDDRLAAMLLEERMLAALSTAIGALAAILAAIGIYGAIASAVAQRQREIGIRMALGAGPGRMARMVIGETFGVVGGGLAVGIAAAFVVVSISRSVLSEVLFNLSPTDPLVFFSSMAAILLIASLAAYVPARRASRIDPVAAIKCE
jgi:predicted permease